MTTKTAYICDGCGEALADQAFAVVNLYNEPTKHFHDIECLFDWTLKRYNDKNKSTYNEGGKPS